MKREPGKEEGIQSLGNQPDPRGPGLFCGRSFREIWEEMGSFDRLEDLCLYMLMILKEVQECHERGELMIERDTVDMFTKYTRVSFYPPEFLHPLKETLTEAADFYVVAAMFYRGLMGRPLEAKEVFARRPPTGEGSPLLQGASKEKRRLVKKILFYGLSIVPSLRYQKAQDLRWDLLELRGNLGQGPGQSPD